MWKKDGQIFDGRITQNGKVSFIAGELPAEQMRSLGYEEYVPPKPEPQPEDPDFARVKEAFWCYVDDIATALTEATGKTHSRSDFPTGAYSSELLTWCAEHGMTEAAIGAPAVKFYGIAADLARLGRNWNELFEEDADGE